MAKKPIIKAKAPSGWWAKLKWKGAEKGFQKILTEDLTWRAEKEAVDKFIAASESFVGSLPDHRVDGMMPFRTGNLHDSIASVVSKSGHVVRASYTKPVATRTSDITGREVFRPTSGMGRQKIIGSLAASTMVRNMNGKFPGKVAITMLIGVPYDERPNQSGVNTGYKDVLVSLFASKLGDAFRFHYMSSPKRMVNILQEAGMTVEEYVLSQWKREDEPSEPIRRTPGRPKGGGGYMGSAGGGMKMRP